MRMHPLPQIGRRREIRAMREDPPQSRSGISRESLDHLSPITVAVARDGHGHLRFAVRDSGIGIDPQVLSDLFAPFAQASLGPALEEHDGAVEAVIGSTRVRIGAQRGGA